MQTREVMENALEPIQDEFENRYYTPTLEDFRIGYEFEYNGHYIHIKSDWEKQVITPEWYGMNYDSGWEPDPIILFYMTMLKQHPENFRVSYLTKEQIKAEGWEDWGLGPSAEGPSFIRAGYACQILAKSNVNALNAGVNEDTNLIIWSIKDKVFYTIYLGKCPSINEFRIIQKLLGI